MAAYGNGIRALRRIQMGWEGATPGTAVPTTATWRGTGTVEPLNTVVFSPEDVGWLTGTDRNYTSKREAQLVLGPDEATFEQFPILCELGIKAQKTGVQDGAGTGYLYTYPLPGRTVNATNTATVQGGDDMQMEEFPYAFCEQWSLSGKGGEALKMGGTLHGRGNSITSYTAATLTFAASGKTITDSTNGLIGFTTGMIIAIHGSASNDGVYTVATGGVAGQIVTTESLVDEAAAATVTIGKFFTGGPAGLTLPTVEEILMASGALYIDAVGGSFGGTIKSNTMMDFTLTAKNGWVPLYPAANSATALYFGKPGFDPKSWGYELKVTMLHDASAIIEKAAYEANTPRRIRLLFTGSALTTTATYTHKILRIDLAGRYSKRDKIGEQNGQDVVQFTFRTGYNPTVTSAGTILCVNQLSVLP